MDDFLKEKPIPLCRSSWNKGIILRHELTLEHRRVAGSDLPLGEERSTCSKWHTLCAAGIKQAGLEGGLNIHVEQFCPHIVPRGGAIASFCRDEHLFPASSSSSSLPHCWHIMVFPLCKIIYVHIYSFGGCAV